MDSAKRIVNADYAYNLGISGKGIGIAILDTGISPMSDFLFPKNRIIAFKDFVGEKSLPYDNNGHGTHVSGIACGNGIMSGGKYSGIAPQSNIISLKILDKKGQGNSQQALSAINWIMDNKDKYNIRVANLSIGTSNRNINSSLQKAMYEAWNMGIVIIVADGNKGSGNNAIASPGMERKIITVGNYIPSSAQWDTCDILAPGTDIASCMSPDYSFNFHSRSSKKIAAIGYIKMSGTSMATPIVSGAVALLLEAQPYLTPQEVKRRLIESTEKSNGGPCLLNIENLITYRR